jgi:hypothetical protein
MRGPLCVSVPIFEPSHFFQFHFVTALLCNSPVVFASVYSCIVIFRRYIAFFCCLFDVTVVLTLLSTTSVCLFADGTTLISDLFIHNNF